MAMVSLQHAWADGSSVSVEVEVENDYPDALATARAEAVRALSEAIESFTEDPS